MTSVRVRAPATSANLGPGFDCAAVALDLWNELDVSDGDGVEVVGEGAGNVELGPAHLGLRAFARIAPIDGKRFVFRNRIPVGRGLGSSAATVALGLVAATLSLGRWPEPEPLLRAGFDLEGHGDNLAAALAGGACLTWERDGVRRLARIALTLPLVPIAVIPDSSVETAEARAALPTAVPHADAAFTLSRAVLLGAALASGEGDLLADAFVDRLHEPYRSAGAPLLALLRAHLPVGAAGVTLSGSGPAVIVWARYDGAASCVAELRDRLPREEVRQLALSPFGAGPA
ncbi:MAG: homoserine kinase [Actinomycetota bacterium]|nr:homoserine kinase [Actinomycetota bacterium]